MALRSDTSTIPPELLLQAYRAGIFPMSDSRDDPEVYWVEPKMRAILPLDGFHLSHSLARTLRRGRFRLSCNEAFDAVIDACAAPRVEAEDSWISQRISESYRELHRHGHAHSIEAWRASPHGTEVLVGGLYGVGFDRVFLRREHVQPCQRRFEGGAGRAGCSTAPGRGGACSIASSPRRTFPRSARWKLRRPLYRPAAGGDWRLRLAAHRPPDACSGWWN